MNKRSIYKKIDPIISEIIPAFLSPDHIINRDEEKYADINTYRSKANLQTDDQPDHISARIIRASLHTAIAQNALEIFMQPIVTLPQRHVKFHELFGRLKVKSGIYLPAERYMNIASEDHIISALDTITLKNAFSSLNQQRQSRPCFINIRPFTLRNPTFMEVLLLNLTNAPYISKNIIFEMNARDFMMLSPTEQKLINKLSSIGCRFSMDHLDDIPADIKFLKRNAISFVKITAKVLLKLGRTDVDFKEIIEKRNNLEANNIHVIIEKIETKHEVLEIMDFGVELGQGFLFGKPDFKGVYTTQNLSH